MVGLTVSSGSSGSDTAAEAEGAGEAEAPSAAGNSRVAKAMLSWAKS